MLPDIFIPDITDLVIEDDEPVDNIQSAKQQRLRVGPLYTSQPVDRPFRADANVGLSIIDPRVERTRLHQLSDILTIAVLSVLAGGQGWEEIEVYGLSNQHWLNTFLALPNGIPSAETFRRVFEHIQPQQFEQCFER